MKKKYCLLITFFIACAVLHAQDRSYIQRSSLGVNIFVDRFSKTARNTVTGLAMNYLQGITPRTDLQMTLAGTFMRFPAGHQQAEDKHLFLELDASIREKLFPGRRRVNPFLQAGLGLSQTSIYYGVFLPAGVGAQVVLPGETFLLLHAQYRVPVTQTETKHLYFSLGMAGIIGKNKKIRTMPVSLPSYPQTTLKDADGDGISDSLDACPLAPGSKAYDGCPDTDGDGIPDRVDKCPLVKGVQRLEGCPEADRDKDGIIDSLDKCPDLPGYKEYEGCPPVEKALRRKIELAAKNVFFETDKYVLLPASFAPLDEVAQIMRDNPYLKLDIAGHTDNAGTDEKNLALSDHRAAAVMDYLLQKPWISKSRLSAAGYGSARPVADNNTPEGRAKNRRVEFVLRY